MTATTERFVSAATPVLEWGFHRWLAINGKHCESPIEQMLLAAITLVSSLIGWSSNFKVTPGISDDKPLGDPKAWPILTIVPQYRLQNYRIDIAIFVVGGRLICIECDGHDFHERTAEQAERDRSRDRYIQEHGIPVLRFTGREIYRDAFKCADEVLKLSFALMREA